MKKIFSTTGVLVLSLLCIQSVSKALVGGYSATGSTAENFAVMVKAGSINKGIDSSRRVLTLQQSEFFYYCGGSLISKRVVLTSASCLKNAGFDVTPQKIIAAPDSEFKGQKLEVVFSAQYKMQESLTISAKYYIVHPGFSGSKSVYEQVDLALILLTEDKPEDWIVAQLEQPDSEYDLPLDVTVLGYGQTDLKRPSSMHKPHLHYANISLQKYHQQKNILVYYPRGNISLGQNDTGGPVLLNDPKTNQAILLAQAIGCVISYKIQPGQRPPQVSDYDRCRSENIFLNLNRHVVWIGQAHRALTQEALNLVPANRPSNLASNLQMIDSRVQPSARPVVQNYNQQESMCYDIPGKPGQAPVRQCSSVRRHPQRGGVAPRETIGQPIPLVPRDANTVIDTDLQNLDGVY